MTAALGEADLPIGCLAGPVGGPFAPGITPGRQESRRAPSRKPCFQGDRRGGGPASAAGPPPHERARALMGRCAGVHSSGAPAPHPARRSFRVPAAAGWGGTGDGDSGDCSLALPSIMTGLFLPGRAPCPVVLCGRSVRSFYPVLT